MCELNNKIKWRPLVGHGNRLGSTRSDLMKQWYLESIRCWYHKATSLLTLLQKDSGLMSTSQKPFCYLTKNLIKGPFWCGFDEAKQLEYGRIHKKIQAGLGRNMHCKRMHQPPCFPNTPQYSTFSGLQFFTSAKKNVKTSLNFMISDT